jgi:hypothetical protein
MAEFNIYFNSLIGCISEIFLTVDHRSRIEKFDSGINFPDPQHWAFVKKVLIRKKLLVLVFNKVFIT